MTWSEPPIERPVRLPRQLDPPGHVTVDQPLQQVCLAALDFGGGACIYCRRRVIWPAVLTEVARLLGPNGPADPLPYVDDRLCMTPEGGGPKRVRGTCPTHPAFERVTANVEHFIPRTRWGSTNDPWNLWPVCYPCNTFKDNRLVEEFEPPMRWSVNLGGWRGLVDKLPALEVTR